MKKGSKSLKWCNKIYKTTKSTKKIKTKFKSSLLSTDVNVTKEKNGKGNFVINFENEIEFNRINKLLNE